jgi:hypothetical protein
MIREPHPKLADPRSQLTGEGGAAAGRGILGRPRPRIDDDGDEEVAENAEYGADCVVEYRVPILDPGVRMDPADDGAPSKWLPWTP